MKIGSSAHHLDSKRNPAILTETDLGGRASMVGMGKQNRRVLKLDRINAFRNIDINSLLLIA